MNEDEQAPAKGFYADQFDAEERQRIAAGAGEGGAGLGDEIAMQRVINHRLLARMNGTDLETLPLDALIDLARAVDQGNARLAQLLKDEQTLARGGDAGAEARDELTKAYAMGLVELAREYGVNGEATLTPHSYADAGVPWPFDMPAFIEMQCYLANTRPPACDECPHWAAAWASRPRHDGGREAEVAEEIRGRWRGDSPQRHEEHEGGRG